MTLGKAVGSRPGNDRGENGMEWNGKQPRVHVVAGLTPTGDGMVASSK